MKQEACDRVMKVMATPRTMDLAITSRCNLRCKYCSHFTSDSDVGRDLSTEEWLKFFEELRRCAVMDVIFQGGEPFCREDLKELLNGIVKNMMRYTILSNGTLITDEIAAFLTSTGRCDNVQVSIDSSNPTTHNLFRGKGTFYKAIKGVKTLQKHNVPVSVRVTIHRQNVRELGKIAKLLLEEIKLPSFSTNVASYMGLCRKNTEQLQLSIEERHIAMEALLKLRKKYNGRISASAGPLAEAESWTMMKKASKKRKKAIPGRGYLTGCGCPMNKVAVRADGTFVPCLLLSHLELGRINQDELKEVWQNHPLLNQLRERRRIPLSHFEFCHNCEYLNYCTGNCPALAYTLLGKVDHPSPDACLKLFIEQGGKLPDENLANIC